MKNTIQLVDVCRQYHLGSADVDALKNIDLEINPGEFLALVGPSGSGKSTLLNLLGGLDHPTSGEINIQGVSLQAADEEELTRHRRHNVGFIFQTFNLLPTLTALENAALPLMLGGVPLAERNKRAEALLERVGLGHRLDHRPTELSGGEQQRAAIARALVNNPQIILADEPTGNLDSSTGAEVMNLLRELNAERGVTLIIVTHDPDVAAYADRIVHLKDGQISKIEIPERTLSTTVGSVQPESDPELKPNGGLRFKDLLRTAFGNLRRRPVRNILTSAGVVIGIVTLVAMVSFGVGVQAEVNRNFETLGLENVFISPTFPDEEDAFDPFGFAEPLEPLTPQMVASFKAMPEVASVTPVLNLPSNMEVSLALGDQDIPVRLSGDFGRGPGMMGDLAPPEMLAGEPLGEGDSQGIVILTSLADELIAVSGGDYADLVSQSVTLTVRLPRGETRDFNTTIIGVEDSHGYQSADLGLKERTEIKAWWYGRPDTLNTDGYDMLVVRASDETTVSAVLDAAEFAGGTGPIVGCGVGDRQPGAGGDAGFIGIGRRVSAVGGHAGCGQYDDDGDLRTHARDRGAQSFGRPQPGSAPHVHRRRRAAGIYWWRGRVDPWNAAGTAGGLDRTSLPGQRRRQRDRANVDRASLAGDWCADLCRLYRRIRGLLPRGARRPSGPGGSLETRVVILLCGGGLKQKKSTS